MVKKYSLGQLKIVPRGMKIRTKPRMKSIHHHKKGERKKHGNGFYGRDVISSGRVVTDWGY